MARIITPAKPAEPAPLWMISGEEVVTIALDKNEVVALRNAVSAYRHKTTERTHPGSLNGAGARVFEALNPIVRKEGWC